MVTRDQVAYGAGAVLLVSVSILYGLFEPSWADSFADEAFLLAGAAWLIGYANCRGFAWADSQAANGLFVASWVLLLGMEFTTELPNWIASNEPWAGVAAVAVHMISYGLTVVDL